MTVSGGANFVSVPPDARSVFAGSLSFLASQVGARSAQLFAARLEPLGLSPRSVGVLGNLATRGPCIQQALADILGMHRNNMVGVIDELEAAGLVRRHRSSADRRAFEIHLTDDGVRVVADVTRELVELDRDVGAGLTVGEQRDLADLLGRVAAAMELTPGVHPHLSRGSG